MATESSEQYDTNSQIVWTGPRVVIDSVIVTDLEAEYCNVANDFLAFTEKAGDLIRIQQQQIDYLESEIRGLEHTNEVRSAVIDQQAARIKALENEVEQLKIRVRDDGDVMESFAAQIKALTGPESELFAPAIVHSATDNLG